MNSKIGIVGAGPSGVHMAYELKQKGYTDVTILERSNRVGGKAENFFYRKAVMTMSAALWNSDYATTLIPLMEKFGIKEVDDSNVINPVPQYIYWPFNNDSVPAFNPRSLVTPEMQMSTFKALNEYIDLHQEYFGTYGSNYGVCYIFLNMSIHAYHTFKFF